MKRIITVSFIALLAISFNGFAQDLAIDSGKLPGLNSPHDGTAALLWDNYLTPSTTGIVSGEWLGLPVGSNHTKCADDFVIPAGETWDITEVTAPGFYSIGLADNWLIEFWTDAPGSPGTLIESRYVTLTNTDTVMGTFPTVTLSEGTYWVSIMGSNNTASTLAEFRWNWYASEDPGVGLEPHLNDLAGFFGGTAGWVTFTSLGIGAFPNLMFQIYGELGGAAGGLLLIDDDTVAADSVEVWLTALGETYTRLTAAAALLLPTSDWLMYDAVLYHGTTSVGAQLDSCTAYVAGGGNLLVMDNDEGFFFNTTPLWLDYLMADYVSDAGSDGVLTGLDMMTGIDPDISADPFPDDCLPNTGAFGTGVPIFRAPGDTTFAGMRGDGGFFRTALLLWDADYTPSALAPAIFARVIDWLVDAIVPVELTSFTASVDQQDVTLNWVTATEINNQGFEVERNSGIGFEKIGYVTGFGTSSEIHTYAFVDASLNEGTYSYRLKQVDLDGSFEYSDVVEVDITVPDVFALEQNYPNPFNPSTKINFSLAVNSKVTLKVFDILGQEVANLINTNLVAGSHSVDFNASLLTSGVYIYRMDATGINGTNFTNVKKMILTK
jgi:hypothetical protein